MVAVYHVAQERESCHGVDQHAVAEHGAAHVGDQHVGNHAHARNDRDVNLGMSEEPEQMLPEQSRSTRVWQQLITDYESAGDEEAGAGDVIEDQENARWQQNGEGGQAHAGRDEPCPGRQRQAPEAHAFAAHIESCGDEIQSSQ